MEAIDAAHLSAQTLTFAPVTVAQRRGPTGTRQERRPRSAPPTVAPAAGLTTRPLIRRREGQLIALVTEGSDPEAYEAVFAAGAELHGVDALALVRGDLP